MSSTSDKTSDVRSKLEKEINNLLQPSNLQNDEELSSAIDGNSNVPVSTIVNKLKPITTDIDIITDILSKCELCVLSGDKSTVKVKRTTERTTILLRDIDEKATEEDIRGLFTDPNLGPIKRIEKELANTWLVTFDSEAHAKSAALQAMKKEINGNRVHARLPSSIITSIPTTPTINIGNNTTTTTTVGNESVDVNNNNNNSSSTTSTPVNTISSTSPLASSYDPNSTDSYSYYTQYSQYYYPNNGGYDYNNEDLPPNAPLGMYDQNIYMNDQVHRQYNNNRRGGGGGGYNNRNRQYNNNNRKDDRRNNNNGNNRRKYSRGGGGRNNRRNDDYYNNNNNNNSYLSSMPSQPIIQELSFPPLASDENTTTYKEPYISYTEDEIIKIVKNYTKFSLPPNLQPGDHSAAIGDKPNARLLELQRSMSIDQALEHSRPFRFDSVDSTDYSNMIYGNIDVDTLSKKPLPSSQTGVIPPPFEPKGYATVVKTGKSNNNSTVQQQQPPPPSTTTTAVNNNNNSTQNKRNRTSSKDKKKDRKPKSNTTATTTTWAYFPAESSSPSSSPSNTSTTTTGSNNVVNTASNNHHKGNRKGSNSGNSSNRNKGKSTNNTSSVDSSSTEPKPNSWASVVIKTSPSPPKSDSSAASTASSSKGDTKVKSDSS